jgi:hypothetical protein
VHIERQNADLVTRAPDRLMTAGEVADYLRVPRKKVYSLPIPRVELSARRIRWLENDVLAFTRRQRTA